MAIPTNILAFGASSSRASINKQLATHAAHVYKAEMNQAAVITILDLNDFEMPIFSADRENEGGIPEKAHAFFKAIGDADALVISYTEHNGSYTAAFKNIFDWCSRIDSGVFQNKPMLVTSTSPGPSGAANVLKIAKDSAGFYAADIRGSLSVPSFHDNFDTEKGELSDDALAASLKTELAKLV